MSPLEMLNRVTDLFGKMSVIETIAADVKVVIADTAKLVEDCQKLVPQGAEDAHVVGSPRPHRLLKAFVRNRVIAGAVHRSGKAWDDVAAVYDAKVDNHALMGAFAEVGVEAPTVGGSFADWLKTVDWSKVFDVIMKLIALIAPFLV